MTRRHRQRTDAGAPALLMKMQHHLRTRIAVKNPFVLRVQVVLDAVRFKFYLKKKYTGTPVAEIRRFAVRSKQLHYKTFINTTAYNGSTPTFNNFFAAFENQLFHFLEI